MMVRSGSGREVKDMPRKIDVIKGKRLGVEDRDELGNRYAKRYAKGESIRSIAVDVGRSYGWVHGLLRSNGVELRGRGGPKPEAKPKRGRPRKTPVS